MIEAIRNAFKVPELRRRMLFTLGMIALYRLGAHIPVPGFNVAAIKGLFAKGGLLGLMDLFAGGALSNFSVLALGIMPYITASIIMQLLTVVIPKLEQWSKEGEVGQKKINQITRYATLGLGLIESIGLTTFFQTQTGLPMSTGIKSLIVLTLVAGTAFIMWLGELITQNGIGNGMSLLIFSSIISRFPAGLWQTIQTSNTIIMLTVAFVIAAVMVAIIVIEKAQRRIPVQYAKRIVGRKVYGGASTYIPLKVNSAGVIPIIFASSFLLFPATIAQFIPGSPFLKSLTTYLSPPNPVYLAFYSGLILFFTYFYTAIVFNPIDIADNMKKYGGFIPGVRPGRPTATYLDKVLSRITLPGAVFLALVALLPAVMLAWTNVQFLKQFGGTSLLITVGVALETMSQLEAQLMMRHYEGFLK